MNLQLYAPGEYQYHMMNDGIKIIVSAHPDNDWDKRVAKAGGDIYQTTIYAKFQEECLGMQTHYLMAYEEDILLGQMTLTSGPRFAKYLNKKSEGLRNFFGKHFKIYTSIRSPLIFNNNLKKQIYQEFLNTLEDFAKDGYAIQDMCLPIDENEDIYNLFYERGFHSDSWGTCIVNTSKPQEELWANIKKSRRNIVNQGTKKGLRLEVATTPKDFSDAKRLLKEMSIRNGIFYHTDKYYNSFFNIFKKENGIVFLVKRNNESLATVTLYIFNNKAIQTALAYGDKCIEEKISAIDFLEWHLIKYCNEHNIDSYDLAGLRPNSSNEKEINLGRSKRRWGGKEIHYPYFSKEYSWWKRKFIASLIILIKRRIQNEKM